MLKIKFSNESLQDDFLSSGESMDSMAEGYRHSYGEYPRVLMVERNKDGSFRRSVECKYNELHEFPSYNFTDQSRQSVRTPGPVG